MPAIRQTEEKKRKPRVNRGPYKKRKPKPPAETTQRPKSSAKPPKPKATRENLTLYDWLTVLTFVDAHPMMTQDAVVNHFKNRQEGALIFDQSTLSRKRQMGRAVLEERAKAIPTALSSKRPRIVTRPDVERALFLWVKHMEKKRESVNGAMLVEKRARFECRLNVPEEERLPGDGWVPSFTKAYNIKEYRRHGEAGSVDLDAVEAERQRLQALLARYPPKDRFNADETGLFAFAPPDRGLATEQMSGKKRDKFRITMMVACNADGTEKLPLLFIGKFAKPRCFGKRTPAAHGFYYRNNKSAWMTKIIFEEWLKQLDIEMGRRNRNICLTLDNFSGHYVDYEPRHIELIFFDPGLTSYVQPCDAGIIRTTKALYRKAFCLRAIEQDEAGAHEIYKINLLEAMLLAQRAWADVTAQTIANCWNHTRIQPISNNPTVSAPNNSSPPAATMNTKAWDIVYAFAQSDEMRLPEAEESLRALLGDQYVEAEWAAALKVVMDAENDKELAVAGLDKLTASLHINPNNPPSPTLPTSSAAPILENPQDHNYTAPITQLSAVEQDLNDAVDDLVKRRRIIGSRLTLEEMLNPLEAQTDEDTYTFTEKGDDEGVEDIARHVRREFAIKTGEIIEIEDDEEDEEDDGDKEDLKIREIMGLCEKLERCVLKHGCQDTSLDLVRGLRGFRIQLRKEDMANAKQVSLDNWFRK